MGFAGAHTEHTQMVEEQGTEEYVRSKRDVVVVGLVVSRVMGGTAV